MKTKLSRRNFIKTGLFTGTTATIGLVSSSKKASPNAKIAYADTLASGNCFL